MVAVTSFYYLISFVLFLTDSTLNNGPDTSLSYNNGFPLFSYSLTQTHERRTPAGGHHPLRHLAHPSRGKRISSSTLLTEYLELNGELGSKQIYSNYRMFKSTKTRILLEILPPMIISL